MKNYDIKPRSYSYALKIMALVDSLPNRRSGRVEAQAASSRRDFINFINHSLKSANECKFWLGLLKDGNILPLIKINSLFQETEELAKILATIVINTKSKVNI